MLSDVTGEGLASVLDVQSSFVLNKDNWICAMTRHRAESNNVLLTRYRHFDLTLDGEAIF